MSERTLKENLVKKGNFYPRIWKVIFILSSLNFLWESYQYSKYSSYCNVNTLNHCNHISMGKSKSIRLMYLNIGHGNARRKLSQIEEILDSDHPHVLFIAEAKCCDTVKNVLLNVHNYVVEDTGGRLFACVDKSVKYRRLDHFNTKNSPSLWLEVGTSTTFIVGGYYREWRIIGDQSSGSIPAQRARFNKFLDVWGRVTDLGKDIW